MKKLFVLAMSAMLIFAATTSAFAASTLYNDSASVELSVEMTAIDFSVTEKIEISLEADSVVATVSDFTITNNNAVSYMQVNRFQYNDEASDNWSLAAYDEETFKDMKVNSGKYALKLNGEAFSDGSVDFINNDEHGYTQCIDEKIMHGESKTYKFDGLASPISESYFTTQQQPIGTLSVFVKFD